MFNKIKSIATGVANKVKGFVSAKETEMLYSYDADGKELYHITEPVLSFREANELELVVNYTISIPLWFAGHQFPSANIPIEVTSILTEKF